MSFNDLERGTTGSPGPERSTGGLNGQSYGRNTTRSNRGGARGPLSLYHAPPSSSSISNQANETADATSSGGAQRGTNPEWKKLADRVGIQIFKLNSNVQGIDKLMELQGKKMRSGRGSRAEAGDKDWMGQM